MTTNVTPLRAAAGKSKLDPRIEEKAAAWADAAADEAHALGEAIRRGDGIRDLLQAALRQARANYALMQAMELILDTN